MTHDEQRKADYLAGFRASGEGWNGECTDDPGASAKWLAQRDKALFGIGMTGEELRAKYGLAYPMYTREEWREEVRDDLTIRGYWDWVAAKLEEDQKGA